MDFFKVSESDIQVFSGFPVILGLRLHITYSAWPFEFGLYWFSALQDLLILFYLVKQSQYFIVISKMLEWEFFPNLIVMQRIYNPL